MVKRKSRSQSIFLNAITCFAIADQGRSEATFVGGRISEQPPQRSEAMLSVAERRRRSPLGEQKFQRSGLPFRFFRIESPRISIRCAL